MERIELNGNEWVADENCILHAAGQQFQISIKKAIITRLGLKARDIIKIYVKKVGHTEEEPRVIKNNFNVESKEEETEEEFN